MRALAAYLLALGLIGCAATPMLDEAPIDAPEKDAPNLSANDDRPALIDKDSLADMHREIADVISQALSGRAVTLAPNVLTAQSTVTIDPAYVNDRSFQRPDHFTLFENKSRCVLNHAQTGKRYVLTQSACTPAG